MASPGRATGSPGQKAAGRPQPVYHTSDDEVPFVPEGALSCRSAKAPQGAWFAVVGPKEVS